MILRKKVFTDSNNDMQIVQVKASQSTVKMGIDYDNQYQVDIPLTVCCFTHTLQCLCMYRAIYLAAMLICHAVICCYRHIVAWGCLHVL